MKIFVSVFFCLVSFSAISQNDPVDNLLRKIDSTYANAVTYRDHGEVEITFINGKNRHIEVKPFKTVFERNRLFSFSFYTRHQALSFYGFQWDSTGIIHGYSFMKSWTRHDGDILSCVAGATGVSMGSGHTVPRLLMPDVISGRHILHGNGQLKILGMEALDGQNCFILTNGDSVNPRMKIWIDEDSLLIRQITGELAGQATHYFPEINRPIPADDRIFNGKKANRAVALSNIPTSFLVLVIMAILIFGLYRLTNKKPSEK